MDFGKAVFSASAEALSAFFVIFVRYIKNVRCFKRGILSPKDAFSYEMGTAHI